jgi:phenylalanyl-tRNA synthetase beta subunit
MYTYSFVSEELMKKTNLSIENLVKMKNALSEELSHLKSSHIPNLLNTIEKNKNNFKELKIFEIEKVFRST